MPDGTTSGMLQKQFSKIRDDSCFVGRRVGPLGLEMGFDYQGVTGFLFGRVEEWVQKRGVPGFKFL